MPKRKFQIYVIHRGGRKASVDYFENHVHIANCSCRKPNRDTPRDFYARDAQQAVELLSALALGQDSFIVEECAK